MSMQRIGGSGQGTRPAGTHGGVSADRGQRTQTAGRPVAGIFSSEGDDVLAVVAVEPIVEEPTGLQLVARAELTRRAKGKK